MRLPENLREQLKIPLGILLKNKDVTKEGIMQHIPRDAVVITVGDATTEKMIRFGIVPRLQIVDSIEKRIKRDLPEGKISTLLHCDNPAAEITQESMSLVEKSFTLSAPVRMIIQGEEDLLVIPALIFAPDNSVLMYGQPNEGLVIVKVTPEIRNKARHILDLMC